MVLVATIVANCLHDSPCLVAGLFYRSFDGYVWRRTRGMATTFRSATRGVCREDCSPVLLVRLHFSFVYSRIFRSLSYLWRLVEYCLRNRNATRDGSILPSKWGNKSTERTFIELRRPLEMSTIAIRPLAFLSLSLSLFYPTLNFTKSQMI